jgi:hypothetical protein
VYSPGGKIAVAENIFVRSVGPKFIRLELIRKTSPRYVFLSYPSTMTKFRPCIDLHSGQVKQIVGGTLTTTSADLKTNYVSKLPAGHFAKLYKENGLEGAHVIMLGPGNEDAAKESLAEWNGGLQIGGGITDQNANQWIQWGARKVRLEFRAVLSPIADLLPMHRL